MADVVFSGRVIRIEHLNYSTRGGKRIAIGETENDDRVRVTVKVAAVWKGSKISLRKIHWRAKASMGAYFVFEPGRVYIIYAQTQQVPAKWGWSDIYKPGTTILVPGLLCLIRVRSDFDQDIATLGPGKPLYKEGDSMK